MNSELQDEQAPGAVSGPVRTGAPYLVSGHGPELFLPAPSGSIVPNGPTNLGDSNHTIVVNITIDAPPAFDPQAIAAVAERAARRAMLQCRSK